MEHLNRLVKTAIEGLGANKSEKAIARVGRAICVLASATVSFDKNLGVPQPSGKYSDEAKRADLKEVVQQLLEGNVFDTSTTSTHKSFSNLKPHSNIERESSQGVDD